MDIYFSVLNFTLSGAIGLIGILTLRKVSTPYEVAFAALPLFFALHQFTEGFVWLGMGGYYIIIPLHNKFKLPVSLTHIASALSIKFVLFNLKITNVSPFGIAPIG